MSPAVRDSRSKSNSVHRRARAGPGEGSQPAATVDAASTSATTRPSRRLDTAPEDRRIMLAREARSAAAPPAHVWEFRRSVGEHLSKYEQRLRADRSGHANCPWHVR